MFSNRLITKSTGTYSDNINRLKEEIKTADAILIGAGAGLSTSAGLTYSGERFEKTLAIFVKNTVLQICIPAASIHMVV